MHNAFDLTTAVDGKGPFTMAQLHFRKPDRSFVEAFNRKSQVRKGRVGKAECLAS